MGINEEMAAATLGAVFAEDKQICVEVSRQDAAVLMHALDTIFKAVRAGNLEDVKNVTGVDNMIDAAHLISVRKALGRVYNETSD